MATIDHGTNQDKNIVVAVEYDKGGRITGLRHPDGRLDAMRYDLLNRRTTHVRGYVPQTTDPDQWQWQNNQWEDGSGGIIPHGSNDQNLITRATYQRSGPLPGGFQSTHTDPNGSDTVRDFDALGRLHNLVYGDPATTNTANVGFSYDLAGNRVAMDEFSDAAMSTLQRRTAFAYDNARRLQAVDVDADGDTVVDHSVSYSYDRVGQRTTLTLDDGTTPLSISYQYDARGQLIGMTDWDSQVTDYEYDDAGRHRATRRSNGLDSLYRYDKASRLKTLRHETPTALFGSFDYRVDGRGNRVQATEVLRTGDGTLTLLNTDPAVNYLGVWSGGATNDSEAVLRVAFAADAITLVMGQGPNYSLYDIYLDGVFWHTIDGYASTESTRSIVIQVNQPGTHQLEIRNRDEHSWRSRSHDYSPGSFDPAAYTLRFERLELTGEYDFHAIDYSYDTLSRLLQADYNDGTTIFNYGYDVAGNLVNMNGVARTYNAVNQLVNDGSNSLSYDRNGNMTSDGVNAYTWDRANRLLSMGSHSYAYDGDGRRISQTISGIVTDYLLDVQPGLTQVIAATTSGSTERYIHGPRGIQAQEDSAGVWTHPLQDGLGSVRGVVSNTLAVNGIQHFAPYGDPFGIQGSVGTDFGFTGEQTDGNGQVYLRARYYNPDFGVFPSLDPFEGVHDRPMSLNGYSWVEGNPVNFIDPRGQFPCASVENDADCNFLQRAIDSVPNSEAVIAIRDAAFGIPENVNDTCSIEDVSNLDGLVAALTRYYPITSITNFNGSALIPVRHRAILLRLAEAVIIMNRKLASIGISLNSALANSLNISFDYVVGNDSGQGYVNLYNTSTYPMQLGNNAITDAIVHEWGHAFDREDGLAHSGYLNTVETGGNFHAVHSSFKPVLDRNAGCDQMVLYTVPREEGYEVYDYPYYVLSGVSPEAPRDYQRCHEGYGYEANNAPDPAEDWADMFMNWIYDGYPNPRRNAGFDKARVKWAANVRRRWMENYVHSNF